MSMILLWKTMRLLSHNLPQEMTQRVLLPFTINITRQVCNYMCTELNIISCNYVWGNVGQWLSYVFLIIWCDPLAKHLHWWWEISRVSWFIMIHVPQIFHVGMPLESPKKNMSPLQARSNAGHAGRGIRWTSGPESRVAMGGRRGHHLRISEDLTKNPLFYKGLGIATTYQLWWRIGASNFQVSY